MEKYKYRVVMKIAYYEMHFDFDTPEDAVNFAAVAVLHLTPKEDGKDAFIYFDKVDVEAEARKQAEKEEEED